MGACADAAPDLASKYEPGEALARWMQRYMDFVATKRGLAAALHPPSSCCPFGICVSWLRSIALAPA
jgi:hypothetical protein